MARPKNPVVEYRIYDLSEEFAVICLDGEAWYISDVKSDRLHFHNCFEIGVCHNGGAVMVIDGAEVAVGAKTVTCVPQYVAHTTYSLKGERSLWSYIFVDFKAVLGRFEAGGIGAGAPENWRVFEYGGEFSLYPVILRVISEIKAKRPGWQDIVSALMFVAHTEIAGRRDGVNEAAERKVYVLEPALRYISKRFAEKIYIEELARLCNLSVTHFRRLFLAVVGASPLQFINRQRVERACHLLLTTDAPALEISEAVGFFSVSGFFRCFKDVFGVTPTEYRAAATESAAPAGKRRSVLSYRGWQSAEVPGK